MSSGSSRHNDHYDHPGAGIRFIAIAGGRYSEGFSERERSELLALSTAPPVSFEELRTPTPRRVESLWVSETPISRAQAALLGVGSADGTGDNLVAMLTRAEMGTITEALGARLLTETEWEYVHRGGHQSLFCVPDLLRDDETTARYMSWDCAAARRPTNGFGLSVLFTPEWTANHWDGDDREAVCRSGGAYFWPWQDQEWVWCMSAMRYPESALAEGRAAGRVALRTSPGEPA